MLAHPNPARRTVVRQSRSLRQAYAEFLQERVEAFKDQIPRQTLLSLADEAVGRLSESSDDQLMLTEVLMAETVDRIIVERLGLPRFPRWAERHVKLRRAQRELTHWRIESDCPLHDLVLYLEPDDQVLVVGRHCAHYGLYLAAYDSPVVYVADELTAVEAAERRAAVEVLSASFEALVVNIATGWFPDVRPTLVVIEPDTLAGLSAKARTGFIERIQERTVPGGFNCIAPGNDPEARSKIAQPLARSYSEWGIRNGDGPWFIATRLH